MEECKTHLERQVGPDRAETTPGKTRTDALDARDVQDLVPDKREEPLSVPTALARLRSCTDLLVSPPSRLLPSLQVAA